MTIPFNRYLHKLRVYECGGSMGPLSIKTVCDETGKKVGSADCTKNCSLFAGVVTEQNTVRCYRTDK